MKTQVVVIHGGTTFEKYEDYILYLKSKEISLDRIKIFNDWKNTLPNELGDDFEVLAPRMPNGTNARYEEWKIWMDRVTSVLDDNLILIGHSLGGIFLAKYLSENVFSKKIKAVILVAAPFDEEGSEESLADFNLVEPLVKLDKQSENIFLIQSEDDICVPFGQLAKYKTALPDAKVMTFVDRGHFLQETFPEIVELIKDIA